MTKVQTSAPTEGEDFRSLLEESFMKCPTIEGSIVVGRIVDWDDKHIFVDVGLKSIGRISFAEYEHMAKAPEKDEEINVYIDRYEDRNGEIVCSHEKARKKEAWYKLKVQHANNEVVRGTVISKVKGGFSVDLGGVVAFLPGSQVDVKHKSLMTGEELELGILKVDDDTRNIVVSRRVIVTKLLAQVREQVMQNLYEGKELEVTVKNIADYGVFAELESGIDGLLHITDIAWKRVGHPSEVFEIGQRIKVKVIKFNKETGRISLGMKQMTADPWKVVNNQYHTGDVVTGRVRSIADYGVFVELQDGIDGLVHLSELAWGSGSKDPHSMAKIGDMVQVKILDVDLENRRISLGMKQCTENPFEKLQRDCPIGSVIDVALVSVSEFGLRVEITPNIFGTIHKSDLSWTEFADEAVAKYYDMVGKKIQVKVMDIDPNKERLSLSVKQCERNPRDAKIASLKRGDVVTCEVVKILNSGVEVKLHNDLLSFIKRNDLSKHNDENKLNLYAVGEKVDAKIVDINDGKVVLSIKAREIDEEREAIATYGSNTSGASLGDILGAAIRDKKDKVERQ